MCFSVCGQKGGGIQFHAEELETRGSRLPSGRKWGGRVRRRPGGQEVVY